MTGTGTRTAKRVPVAPFRERFVKWEEQERITAQDLAIWMDWYAWKRNGCGRKMYKPDTDRVRRVLGLVAVTDRGHRHFQETVQHDTAVKLCEHLALDHWDVGL